MLFWLTKHQNALIETLIIFFLDSFFELPSSSPERIVNLAGRQNMRSSHNMVSYRATNPNPSKSAYEYYDMHSVGWLEATQRIREILRFRFDKCQNALIETLIIFFLDSFFELPSSSPERIVNLALQQNTRNGSGVLQDRVTRKLKFPLKTGLLHWEAHWLDIREEYRDYSEFCYFGSLNIKMPSSKR